MKILKKLAVAALLLPVAVAMADTSSFFQVGKCYLFLPRHAYFNKGEVVQVTPQEVVFKNLKEIVTTMDLTNEDKATMDQKHKALKEYWNSDDRSKFEKSLALDAPTSFSRAEMAAIELDKCGK